MSYRDATRRLAAGTEATVLALWAAHLAGRLDRDAFTLAAAAAVAAGNARAVGLADLALAAQLTVALGADAPPLGLAPDDDTDRLRAAVATILAKPYPSVAEDEAAAATARNLALVARAEPLAAGRAAMTRGLRERDVGWTRRTGPDPCPLCRELDDGTVLPPGTPMADHPGCACTARIVLDRDGRMRQ